MMLRNQNLLLTNATQDKLNTINAQSSGTPINIITLAYQGSSANVKVPHINPFNVDVVMAAVQQKGFVLAFASAEPQADREVVMTAVAQNGEALQLPESYIEAFGGLLDLEGVTHSFKAKCLCLPAEELIYQNQTKKE